MEMTVFACAISFLCSSCAESGTVPGSGEPLSVAGDGDMGASWGTGKEIITCIISIAIIKV